MTQQDERSEWDNLTPPTQQELDEACALRDALEGKGDHPDAALCRALRIANDPPEIDPTINQWLVKRAVHRAAPATSKTTVMVSSAAAALALAAGIALLLSSGAFSTNPTPAVAEVEASLIPSRSTQPLFDEPFERHRGTSGRIDRIARARGRDYRSNYYARMGVRQ